VDLFVPDVGRTFGVVHSAPPFLPDFVEEIDDRTKTVGRAC